VPLPMRLVRSRCLGQQSSPLADGTLTLAFPNQHRLTILDSFKEYESYDISRPGQTIIV
jgi:hypothetical protein